MSPAPWPGAGASTRSTSTMTQLKAKTERIGSRKASGQAVAVGRGSEMAVYVDAANLPFRRMVMCHMVADSHEELVAMADRIGVSRRWIQKRGLPAEHFDICLSKKKLALAAGALEISQRGLGKLLRRKGEAADEGSRKTPPAETANPGSGQLVEAVTSPTSRSTG